MRERIGWIDVCRGLGILSVIYAHGLDDQSIRYFFYAFHIPLFFFLSGIVFHHKNHESFSSVVKKALNNVLLPYFLFAVFSYVVWLMQTQFAFFSLSKVPGVLWNILYGNGNQKQFFYNVVIWFLPTLFITRILFGAVTVFTNRNKNLIGILLIFSGVGYGISRIYPGLTLPFGLEVALNAIVFFGSGYLWNAYLPQTKTLFKRYALPLFLVSLSVCIVAATLNYNPTHQQIDMRVNRLNDYLLFYFGAFSGILSCIALSEMIHTNRVLKILGKHSMILFIWHLPVFSAISQILRIFTNDQTINTLRNLYLAPLYSIISVALILLLARLLTFATGQLAARRQS